MADQPSPGLERFAVAAWCVAATLAATCVWLATSLYGPEIDGDGAWTLSAARNLLAGRGLVTCTDELYSLWPPLYPWLLAGAESLGIDAFQFVRALHALAFAGIVVLTARTVLRISGSAWLSIAQAWLVALSLSMLHYFVILGSEALFILLCAAALALAARWAENPTRASWIALVALCAAACLQRYLGVALVMSLVLLIVLHRTDLAGRQCWRRAAELALFSALPLGAWLLRNRWLEGAWTGGRTGAQQSLWQIASDVLTTLRTWSTPGGSGAPMSAAPWFVLAILVVLGAVGARRALRNSRDAIVFDGYALFVLVYAALLVGLSTRWLVDPVKDRLLLPVFPIGVALTLIGAHAVTRLVGARQRMAGAASSVLLIAMLGWHVVAAARAVASNVASWRADGAGSFHTRFWMEQPLVDWMRAHPPDGALRSNVPEMVWLITGKPAHMLRQSRKLAHELGEEVAQSREPRTVLWFMNEGRPVLFTDEIAQSAAIDVVLDQPRARVVRVAPR